MAIYQQGMTDPEIGKLQQSLEDAGYDPGGIDNIYGPRTADAVRKYQKANNLTVDAIAGPQTLGKLYGTAQSTQPTQPVSQQDQIQQIISQYPEAKAIYDQSQLAAKKAGQNAMEQLNERGILNSTITSDRVAQIEQEGMTDLTPRLFALEEQKKQQRQTDAYNRWNMLGYADNEVAKTLGVNVGTPSYQAKEVAANRAASAARANAPKEPTAAEKKAQITQQAYDIVNQFAQNPNTDLADIQNFIRKNVKDFTDNGIDIADLLRRAELLYNDSFFENRTEDYYNSFYNPDTGEYDIPW